MKIWHKYLLSNLIKTFLFSFFCVFSLYVIVDLSINGVKFFEKSTFQQIISFYLDTLASLFELFCSLSLLLSALWVLLSLNTHRELLALQMAGLSKKKLLAPFFLFAVFLTSLCYMNTEFLLPNAKSSINNFKKILKKKQGKKIPLYTLSLEDGSTLVYQRFHEKTQELFDVFWVRSPNDIWHMKTLSIAHNIGKEAHHLTRNAQSEIERSETFLEKNFPEILWDNHSLLDKQTSCENRPISLLISQAIHNSTEKPGILSHLYYKLFTPLSLLLILFAIAPTCMTYSRGRPLFLIAACAIFGFISLKVILESMLILAENQVLSPLFAISLPLFLTLGIVLKPFVKLY
jgi:lipopolysaccharide export system permease protein